MDERALLQGPGGEPGWLGRRCMAQGCRAAVAASVWPTGRGGAAWRVAVRRGVRGEVLQSEPKSWGQRVGSGARLQYARSGRVQCMHTRCSAQCRGMLQVACGDGIYQIEVRSNGESSGHAGLIRGASSQCNATIMPELVMLSRCLAKCHMHLGRSWGGQKLQMGVSVEEREGGDVSWPKAETC